MGGACGAGGRAPDSVPQGAFVELFPIHLLILVVLCNRYVLGAILKKVRGGEVDRKDPHFEPTVAIVIPAFNEGRGIFETLRSLGELDYPKEKLEIIVVDDHSADDTYQWARLAAESQPNTTVIRSPRNEGKRKAIIRGTKGTQAEIVMTIDSDVVVDRAAVRELVMRFTKPEIAAVGGRTYVNNRDESWLTRMLEVKFYFAQVWLKDLERSFLSVLCLSGCLTAYRRKVLDELEPLLEGRNVLGVPIKYGEDRFLCRQIVKAGYKTLFTTEAFCFTAAPPDLRAYFSQQLRWRRSNLIDLFCGLSHAWKLHPVVGLHYVSLLALLLAYPVKVVDDIMNDRLFSSMVFHVAFVSFLSLVYWMDTKHLPADRKVSPVWFLSMAVLMPVSYLLLTPLALFTLDSGSWETRGRPTGAEATSVEGRLPVARMAEGRT